MTYLPVQEDGLVNLDELKAAIRPTTSLVSVMFVNNEVGVIQPVEEIGKICRANKIFFHSDGAQAFGKVTPCPFGLSLNHDSTFESKHAPPTLFYLPS